MVNQGKQHNLRSDPVTQDALRNVMRQWTTGVTIVSSCWHEENHGMTVSSFTSISLDPPLVSISLAQAARTHSMVEKSGFFGISILSEGQQELSERFAGRVADGDDRFAGVDFFSFSSGAPLVAGSLGWLDCQVVSKIEAGQNTIFIGRVIGLAVGEGGAPLLYFDRNYQKICE